MFNPGSPSPSLLKGSPAFGYRAFTFSGRAFQRVRSKIRLIRVRSPLLTESLLLSFPVGTEMFQFPTFAPHAYAFSVRYPKRDGLPHSDIHGSRLVYQLPVAYRR